MIDRSITAWNNFVMKSGPEDHPPGSEKRAAALAALFWSVASNGGIHNMLDATHQYAADEIVSALSSMGATRAVDQLRGVLAAIGVPLQEMSSEQRFHTLSEYWPDTLDEFDALSNEADVELQKVLERHVALYEADYLDL